jgi:outer membrane protein
MFRHAVALAVSALTLAPHPGWAQKSDTLRLSIEDALTRALRANPAVRQGEAQLDVAEAQITTARAAGLPQLRFNGTYTQVIENARASIVGNVFGQAYTYNANVNLSQSLFQGGRIFAGTRAASDVRRASRLDLSETKAQVSVDVQRAYLDVLFANQLYEIQTRNAQLADERVAQVQQLEQGGRAARYDVLRARVERANLEPTLLQARSNRELAMLELKRQLDLPADQPVLLTSALDVSRLESVVASIADSTRDPIRPSVRAAEFTLEARREGIRVARADFLPTVSTFIQTGYLALPGNNGFPTVWGRFSPTFCPAGNTSSRGCQNDGWFADRNFGVQVQWPLFDGLRAKGNMDLAQAQARVAELQLDQERKQVAIERAGARAELDRARSAFAARQRNSAEADEAFRLASLRFTRGLGTQLEVSDAQVALLTAQTNEARAVFDLYLATAELARARGTSVPLPPTRPATP